MPESMDANPEQKFYAKLVQMAKLAKVEVGTEIFEAYDSALGHYGYANVCKALDKLLENMDRFQFPSIKAVKEILEPTVSTEGEATQAASLIVRAISEIGPYQPAKARALMGDLAWQVVLQCGGWGQICEIQNSELGMHRAQWRMIALGLIERARAGRLTEAPSLPSPEPRTGQLQSLSSFLENIRGNSAAKGN